MSSADVDINFSAAELKRVRSLVQTVRAEKRLMFEVLHLGGTQNKWKEKRIPSRRITLAAPSASVSKAKVTIKIKEQTERKIFMTSNSFPTWFKRVQVQLRLLLFPGTTAAKCDIYERDLDGNVTKAERGRMGEQM